MDKLLFSVAVMTYNQAEYISETLDSILGQEHNYPYEIVVGDDYSTDDTRKILLEYKKKHPTLIRLLFNEKNFGMIKNYFNVIRHCLGKYIMQCAGDDYWLPNKVAIQMSYVLENPSYGMFYTKVNLFDQNTSTFTGYFGGDSVTFDALIENNTVPALSVVFKNELIKQYIAELKPEEKAWPLEDYPFWLWLSLYSKIYFINQVTGVYRIVSGSISHPANIAGQVEWQMGTIAMKKYFYECKGMEYDIKKYMLIIYKRYLSEALFAEDINSIKILYKKAKFGKLNEILWYFISNSKTLCHFVVSHHFLRKFALELPVE